MKQELNWLRQDETVKKTVSSCLDYDNFFRSVNLKAAEPYKTDRAVGYRRGALEDRVRTGVFDADQLESLMVAAFDLMGMPEAQARELALSILRAAERPQSGDPESPDRDPTRRLV
jgi:hypothetical protein